MSHDDREEPMSARNGNGNGHGEDHTGETLIRRLAREEVASLALSRIAHVESSIAAFRDVSLDRYTTLTGELAEVRAAVIALQGDAAVTRKNTEKIVVLLECLETRVMLAFSDMGAKTGDMRGQLLSVHETDAEHDAAIESLRKETQGTRALVMVRVTTLVAVAIAAWEIAKWALPILDKLTH